MDWIPIVFLIFKFLVLGTGMYFAIKWHYDQAKKKQARPQGRAEEQRAVLRASGKAATLFVLSLLALGLSTFVVIRMLGLDLTVP